MQTKIIERYFFFSLLLATIFFTFLIFSPFWIIIILSISFSIILHPLYNMLNNKKFPNWLSSLICVLLFSIILIGPILGIGALVFKQSQEIYFSFVKEGNMGIFIDSIDKSINNILPEGITFNTKEKVFDFVLFLSDNIAKIFSSTLSLFFSFFLMLLAIFYFLKDGQKWKKSLIILSPLSDRDDQKIIEKLSNSVEAVMKGYLLIAIMQGVLLGFGLWVFNVPNFALWGLVASIASLIPMIGTAFVSVPAIIFLFITGNTLYAFGLLIWAITVVGTVDNFLNPLIIGRKINLPPLLVLFSVLGGITILGPVGILIGPLTLSLLYTLISIYKNEFKEI